MSKLEADVVIVGGGIVGCAAAYYLAKRGVSTILFEKEGIGGAQSSRNWGFVRQQGRDPFEVPLMVESIRIWSGIEKELGTSVDWVQSGNLGVASTPEKLALFEGWSRSARELGLKTQILSSAEMNALIPEMRGRWLGGMYTGNDGHAEPLKTTKAFADAARAKGVRIIEACAVEGIGVQDGSVHEVWTEQGPVKTRTVVAAAGAWSAKLARPLGLSLPQRLVRSTVARTNPMKRLTEVAIWASGVAIRQRADGTINLGGGGWTDHDVTLESLRHTRLFLPNYWKNRKLFSFHFGKPFVTDLLGRLPGSRQRRHPFLVPSQADPQPNPAKCRRTFDEFQKLFPSMSPVSVTESWAGYIDATPDALPVLGPVDYPRGFVFATGFSGHGFGMGPIAGRLVAELVDTGKTSLDISKFRFSRFAEGDIGKPRSVM